jgi:hypothetical protein
MVPLCVRPLLDRFELIDGLHRLLAAIECGFAEVPCTVVSGPTFAELYGSNESRMIRVGVPDRLKRLKELNKRFKEMYGDRFKEGPSEVILDPEKIKKCLEICVPSDEELKALLARKAEWCNPGPVTCTITGWDEELPEPDHIITEEKK